MINIIKRKVRDLIGSQIDPFREEIFIQTDLLKFSVGELLERTQRLDMIDSLQQAEFKVFSQWGEDGIIQFLTKIVPITHRNFIEIGVENYWESNTRFLLMKDNWKGVIIDGSDMHARFLERSGLRWRHNIDPVTAFVTRENINELLAATGIAEDLGLLSLDIDGVDYWVLEAIKTLSARILIVEYNSRFGCAQPVTVPYDAGFNRTKAHYSNCYFGASLTAFCDFAGSHGYAFVGTSSAGSNAFFVRSDLMPPSLQVLSPVEGFVATRSRESRDREGNLTYLNVTQERELIKDLPVVDVRTHSTLSLKEVFQAQDRLNV
jgi:hypothetical protein